MEPAPPPAAKNKVLCGVAVNIRRVLSKMRASAMTRVKFKPGKSLLGQNVDICGEPQEEIAANEGKCDHNINWI